MSGSSPTTAAAVRIAVADLVELDDVPNAGLWRRFIDTPIFCLNILESLHRSMTQISMDHFEKPLSESAASSSPARLARLGAVTQLRKGAKVVASRLRVGFG